MTAIGCIGVCTGILKAGWLYTEEVYTSWYFSRGCLVGERIYFVTTYRLMQKPKGIARLPDGGTAKGLFSGVFLYNCDTDGKDLQLCARLEQMQLGGNGIAQSAIMKRKDNQLEIMYYGSNMRGDKVNRYHMFTWDLKGKTITPITAIEEKKTIMKDMDGLWTVYRKESVGISSLKKKLAGYTLAEWKLPSPLDYVDKSTDDFLDDLVNLKGDRYYRDAIIQENTGILTDARIAELLRRIQERKDSLDGYEQMKYKMTAADLEEKLIKLKNNQKKKKKSN